MEENNELIHAISELQHPIIKVWRENHSLTKTELEALLKNNQFRVGELIDEFIDAWDEIYPELLKNNQFRVGELIDEFIDSIDAWDEIYPDFWHQFRKVMKLKGKSEQDG